MAKKKEPKTDELKRRFFGMATVGEKGQIVIPNDARKKLKIKKGEKLIVFEAHDGMLALARIADMERAAQKLSKSIKSLKNFK